MNRPAVICIAGLKGGTGKTTTAVLLAATLHRQGIRVLLLDADPQRSATHWRSAAVGEGEALNLPTVVAVDPPTISDTVRDMGRAFELVVIDTPARLAVETRRALLTAGEHGGLALIPLSASGVDLRATLQTADLVREAKEFRPELQVAVLRNKWDRRLRVTSDVQESIDALQFPVLESLLSSRTAYTLAVTHGMAIEDTADSRAMAEVRELVNELLGEEDANEEAQSGAYSVA